MAEKYEETRAKLRRDIVAATGKLNGENPKEFVLNLLHQTEQGVSKTLG